MGCTPRNGGFSSTASQNEQLLFLIRWYNVFSLSCSVWNIGNYNSMLQNCNYCKAWATDTCCFGNRQYPKKCKFSAKACQNEDPLFLVSWLQVFTLSSGGLKYCRFDSCTTASLQYRNQSKARDALLHSR